MPNDENAASKVRDHLANERTLLSWIRLSIAITALGFVVARFGLFVAELAAAQGFRLAETGLSVPVGVSLVLVGPLFAILAVLRFRTAEAEIDSGHPQRHHELIYAIIGTTVLVGLGLALYLVVVATTIARGVATG